MGKKKKQKLNKKSLIEFEIEKADEIEMDNIGKTNENVVLEAETEKLMIAEDEKKTKIEPEKSLIEEKVATENSEHESEEKKDDDSISSVTEEVVGSTEKQRNKKIDLYIEFGLIFILGVLIGIAVKTEAGKRITIGFDDYQMRTVKHEFNINDLQAEVTKKTMEEANSQDGSNESEEGSKESPQNEQDSEIK